MLMREGPLENHKGTVAASAATVNVRAARLHQHDRIELHARHLFSHLVSSKNPFLSAPGRARLPAVDAAAPQQRSAVAGRPKTKLPRAHRNPVG